MKTYLLRVRPKGALTWREEHVALRDPQDTATLISFVSSVIGRDAKSGDQIEVRDGHRVVTKKFTV